MSVQCTLGGGCWSTVGACMDPDLCIAYFSSIYGKMAHTEVLVTTATGLSQVSLTFDH